MADPSVSITVAANGRNWRTAVLRQCPVECPFITDLGQPDADTHLSLCHGRAHQYRTRPLISSPAGLATYSQPVAHADPSPRPARLGLIEADAWCSRKIAASG